jgi:predicted NBD/HSP70 family sugar kinase
MKVLCYDIGGTGVKYGVCEDGRILEKGSFPTDASLGQLHMSESLKNVAEKYLKEFPDIVGVGVSTTGSVDYDNAVIVVHPLVLPYFENWDFKAVFAPFGLDAVADNDVNSFAMAECHAENRKHLKNYLVITVGTGIGGAIVVDGKVQRGANWNGGEVGRMYLDGLTSWEQLGSITAMIRIANEEGMNVVNGQQVCDRYDAGEEVAVKVMNQLYKNVAKGIANLIFALNPEAVIIGGGISRRNSFIEGVKRETNAILPDGFKNTADILPASYCNDGGILGAYYNFMEKGKKKGQK